MNAILNETLRHCEDCKYYKVAIDKEPCIKCLDGSKAHGYFEKAEEGETPSDSTNQDQRRDRYAIHTKICDEIKDIYYRKNQDYGDSFHETFVEEGFAMSRIRLADKLSRFKTLSKDPDRQLVMDEGIRDTLIDLANYAIMTVVEMERAKDVQ